MLHPTLALGLFHKAFVPPLGHRSRSHRVTAPPAQGPAVTPATTPTPAEGRVRITAVDSGFAVDSRYPSTLNQPQNANQPRKWGWCGLWGWDRRTTYETLPSS